MYGAMMRPAISSITRLQKLATKTIAQAIQGLERRIRQAFYGPVGNASNSPAATITIPSLTGRDRGDSASKREGRLQERRRGRANARLALVHRRARACD